MRSDKSMAQVAEEFGVSPRTVQNWAKKGEWARKRADYFGVNKAKSPSETMIAIGRKRVRLDYEKLAREAIEMLVAASNLAEPKSLESVLSTQLAFMKFARQYDPLTVKELVEIAIANDIDFNAVMAELAKHRDQTNAR